MVGLMPSAAFCLSGYCFLYGSVMFSLSLLRRGCAKITHTTSVLCSDHTCSSTCFNSPSFSTVSVNCLELSFNYNYRCYDFPLWLFWAPLRPEVGGLYPWILCTVFTLMALLATSTTCTSLIKSHIQLGGGLGAVTLL